MAEYIEREATLSVIRKLNTPAKSPAQKDMLRTASVYIQAIPAADVAPVVHGRWGEYEVHPIAPSLNGYPCTVCGQREQITTNYCPNCGARMDLEG